MNIFQELEDKKETKFKANIKSANNLIKEITEYYKMSFNRIDYNKELRFIGTYTKIIVTNKNILIQLVCDAELNENNEKFARYTTITCNYTEEYLGVELEWDREYKDEKVMFIRDCFKKMGIIPER